MWRNVAVLFRLPLIFLAATGVTAEAASSARSTVDAAFSQSSPRAVDCLSGKAAIAGVKVDDAPSDEAQLRMLRVTADRGAFMNVYFDEQSEVGARRYAGCLGVQLTLLTRELFDEREGAQWASVVFTSDRGYAPPRGADVKTRWVILTSPDAPDELKPRPMVFETLPHEQVHDFQSRNGAIDPLWFAEGHATWLGLRVTAMLDPEAARKNRAERLAELRSTKGPVNLAGWGQRRIKRDAILRQLSPEDRAKIEADPSYIPRGGAFTFTIDDFETDESMSGARYAAALLVFEGLERRHGAKKVSEWAREVTSQSGEVSESYLRSSIRQHFAEEMDQLLKD
jgi:hypothetical protein